LRGNDTDSGAVAQFIVSIEKVGDIETELEPAIFLRETKGMGEPKVHRIVSRQLVGVGESTSQAAAIKDIGIDSGVFVGVGGSCLKSVALVVDQENGVIFNKSEFVRQTGNGRR
jgi:hypothetical protein